MRPSRIAIPALSLLLTCAAAPVRAAALLPPTLAVRGQENAVAFVTVVGFPGDSRVRFRQERIVQPDRSLEVVEDDAAVSEPAEPPREIDVRVPPEVAGELALGQPWILVYTSLERLEIPHTYQPDPEGPRLVVVPAVGPGLLEDSAAMRRLIVRPEAEGDEPTPRQRLDDVLEQVERPHAVSRLFVLAELALRADLQQALTPADVARFAALLERSDVEPRAREYVLRAFLPLRDRVATDWIIAECRREVDRYEPPLDLRSAIPSLLTISLSGLEELGGPEDAERALRHLDSNSEAVSLAAFQAAAALDPDRTAEVVEPFAFEGDLPRDTQWAILRFLAERGQAGTTTDG